jgi:hypothetical protein
MNAPMIQVDEYDECQHCIDRATCIICSPKFAGKTLVVMKCNHCSKTGGQTWHADGVCCRCGRRRDAVPNAGDLGIYSD